jgi:hypothetical protein
VLPTNTIRVPLSGGGAGNVISASWLGSRESRGGLRYAHRAVRSQPSSGRENRMAFMFRLEQADGTPADPAPRAAC